MKTVYRQGTCINNEFSYEYQGIDQVPILILTSYFDKTYKKAAGRVNFLRSIWPSVDQKCAELIYNTMILPVFHILQITWSWLVSHLKKSDQKNIEQQSLRII